MKNLKALLCLFLFGCATNGGPGFRLSVNPAAQYGASAPMSAWYDTNDRWQIEYVAYFVDLLNKNGMRCPYPITVGAIRYELLTRYNQGRVPAGSLVYQEMDKLLPEMGCVISRG